MFDLKVHSRDKKSGRVNGVNPYRAHIERDAAGGQVITFERGGKFFAADGSEAKRPAHLEPKGAKQQATKFV